MTSSTTRFSVWLALAQIGLGVSLIMYAIYEGTHEQPEGLPHRPAAQSYDQENLKRDDIGCPTAVYVAPQGNLIECEQQTLSPEVAAKIKAWDTAADWHRFSSLADAAMYGATRLGQCSHFYECSGFIVIDPKDGKFLMSPVRTDYASDHVQVADRNPEGMKRIADIHSHPCVPQHVTGKFSPQDMMESITTRTIAFMVDLCTGDVHAFVPGVTKPDEAFDDDAEIYMTGGLVIGRVASFPTGLVADVGL